MVYKSSFDDVKDKSSPDDSVHTSINAYITFDHDNDLVYPSRFTIHYSCILFIPI
jgi:hypothetical protein